jgi:AcrR family transcriptional regulator
VFGEVEIRQAQALLRDPEIRVADVAKRLGVSEATLYRHLPGGRAGIAP